MSDARTVKQTLPRTSPPGVTRIGGTMSGTTPQPLCSWSYMVWMPLTSARRIALNTPVPWP